jgi:hypothetical protein
MHIVINSLASCLRHSERKWHTQKIPLSGSLTQTNHSELVGGGEEALYHCAASLRIAMASRPRGSNNKPRDVLEELRQTLGRLDRTGDSASPSIAHLRRIIADRIAELEAASLAE